MVNHNLPDLLARLGVGVDLPDLVERKRAIVHEWAQRYPSPTPSGGALRGGLAVRDVSAWPLHPSSSEMPPAVIAKTAKTRTVSQAGPSIPRAAIA